MVSLHMISTKLKGYFIIFLLILAGCGKSMIPLPSIALPERNIVPVNSKEIGNYPDQYQLLLKKYLQKNLLNQDSAKLDFINTPQAISISHLGENYVGYRVCLSINSKNRKNIYGGYKTHLFLFNNNKIILHLYDSGLLKIPFELCVDRDEQKSIFIEDIPDKASDISINEMDDPDILNKETPKPKATQDIYILCQIDGIERTFYFNQNLNLFFESIEINDVEFNNVRYSQTHISATNNNEEILINRVSGKIISSIGTKKPVPGICKLLSEKKF